MCNDFYFLFLQSGEASWWRVGYQRGLPRLVFIKVQKKIGVDKKRKPDM